MIIETRANIFTHSIGKVISDNIAPLISFVFSDVSKLKIVFSEISSNNKEFEHIDILSISLLMLLPKLYEIL